MTKGMILYNKQLENMVNMLRKGLTSELFYLAFLMPDSGYALAQRSQNTKKTPNTSKTGPALKKLQDAGYLVRKEDGKLYPITEKLSADVISYLENEMDISLEDGEAKILKNMLSENGYFLFVGMDIFSEIENRPTASHNIDALKTICDKIGLICATILESKKKSGNPEPVNRKSFEEIQKELKEFVKDTNIKMETSIKGKKSVRNNKMESINMATEGMKSFIMMSILFEKIPNDTIQKFANLWSQYLGFQIGIAIANMDPKKLLNR